MSEAEQRAGSWPRRNPIRGILMLLLGFVVIVEGIGLARGWINEEAEFINREPVAALVKNLDSNACDDSDAKLHKWLSNRWTEKEPRDAYEINSATGGLAEVISELAPDPEEQRKKEEEEAASGTGPQPKK